MSGNRRVAWSQGMFLVPQHFQQLERATEEFATAQVRALTHLNWGLSVIEYDLPLLRQGQFRLLACRGLLPDGTPFDAPGTDALPEAISVASEHMGQTVWLDLPLRTPGEPEYLLEDEVAAGRRGLAHLAELRDCSDREQESVEAHLVGLNLQLIVSKGPPPGYAAIPLRRIEALGQNLEVRLDAGFAETVAVASGSAYLKGVIADIGNRLAQRSRNSSGRAARGGSTEALYEFLFLLAVNRHAPVLRQLVADADIHPYALYMRLLEMAGELASFGEVSREAPQFPPYDHADQHSSFQPVTDLLRAALSQVLPQTAVRIPLIPGPLGAFQGLLPDTRLASQKNRFVLGVLSAFAPELVRSNFAGIAKVSTPETIKSLVSSQAPGFVLHPLAVVPNEVRNPNPRAVYFEIAPRPEDYRGLVNGVAVHVAKRIEGLSLELWVLLSNSEG